MIEPRQRHRRPNAQPFGVRGNMGAHDMHRRADAIRAEVMFRQPDRVITRFIHDLHAFKRAIINGRQRYAAAWPAEKLQNTKFQSEKLPNKIRVNSAFSSGLDGPRAHIMYYDDTDCRNPPSPASLQRGLL